MFPRLLGSVRDAVQTRVPSCISSCHVHPSTILVLYQVYHQTFTDYQVPEDPCLLPFAPLLNPNQNVYKVVTRPPAQCNQGLHPSTLEKQDSLTIQMCILRVEEIRHMEDQILSAQHKHDLYFNAWYHWL